MMIFSYIIYYFIINISFLICQQLSELDFIIESPNDGDIFVIKPTENDMDLTIKYTYNENFHSISNICFQIHSDINNIEILKETCIPPTHQSVIINNIPPNSYRLSAVTIGQNSSEMGPRIQKSFEIHSMSEFLPNLKILNQDLLFYNDNDDNGNNNNNNNNSSVVNSNEDDINNDTTTPVTIFYSITPNIISPSNFLLCCQLLLLPDNLNLTDINCFETSQSSLSMNLLPNTYQLHFFYQDKLTQTYLPPSSSSSSSSSLEQDPLLMIEFQVISFQSFLKNFPMLTIVSNHYELVVNETTHTASIAIPYSFDHPSSTTNTTSATTSASERSNAIVMDTIINKRIEICMEVINMNTSQFFLTLTCFIPSTTTTSTTTTTATTNTMIAVASDSESDATTTPDAIKFDLSKRFKMITIEGLPEGQYQLNLVLRNRLNPDIIYFPSLHIIEIEARPTIDFKPTFEWQRVNNWHIVPIGLEFQNYTQILENNDENDGINSGNNVDVNVNSNSSSSGSSHRYHKNKYIPPVILEARIPACYSCLD